jgi:hypothetical protein
MEKDRERRFASALAFRSALDGLLTTDRRTAASLRASMPTTPAFRQSGETTNVRAARRKRTLLFAGMGAGLLVAAGGAAIALRSPIVPPGAGPPASSPAAVSSSVAAAASPAPTAAAVVPTGPTNAAVVAPEPLPPAKIEAAPRPAVREPARRRGGREAALLHATEAPSGSRGAELLPVASPPLAPPAAPPAAAPAPAEPPPRTARDALTEAERLLGEGEVGQACARGEEAKRLAGKLPAVYKFLGKCYMRAGRAREASENYAQYLDLAPNAPDAPFIKSMIR